MKTLKHFSWFRVTFLAAAPGWAVDDAMAAVSRMVARIRKWFAKLRPGPAIILE